MHELKTARLMQACTMISAHLTKQNLNDFSKLGKTIGMIFQLLDDKDDQNEEENIFKNYAKEAHEYLDKMMSEMKVLLDKYQLKRTQEFLEKYYLK